jgi:tyrosine-protein kinase Etk/Wzc
MCWSPSAISRYERSQQNEEEYSAPEQPHSTYGNDSMIQQSTYTDPSIDRLEIPRSLTPRNEIYQYTMLEFLIQFARRKWLIAKITAFTLAIGLVLCFALPNRYTAVTRIMPPKQSQSMAGLLLNQTGLGALAQANGASLLSDPNSMYVGLLKSRPVADEIIRIYNLQGVYGAKDMTEARSKLKEYTSIVSEPSTLISISVTDRDKKRAADMANSYTEQLRALSKTISLTEASKRRAFFEQQLQTQKETLVEAEATLQQVQQSKGLVRPDVQAGMLITGVAALRGQIAAKEVELNALRSFSTEHNSDVQLAEHELAGMRTQAQQMEDHDRPAGSSDIALKDVPKASLDYVRAQREVQYHQAFFDVLLRQFEGAKLDEAREAAVIQVVESAVVPDHKSSPKRFALLAISLFIGLFLGCLSTMVLQRLEQEQMDPEGSVALQRLKVALLRTR